jgi:hypothetical protein
MRYCSISVLVAVLLLPACGKDDSPGAPTPTPIDLTGRWAGDLSFQGATGRMTWTLTQASAAVTGPVLVTLPSGTVVLNGFLTGTLSGSSLAYAISVAPNGIPSQPSCGGQIGGTMTVAAAPVSMGGNISVISTNCAIQFATGTFNMTKQ